MVIYTFIIVIISIMYFMGCIPQTVPYNLRMIKRFVKDSNSYSLKLILRDANYIKYNQLYSDIHNMYYNMFVNLTESSELKSLFNE